MTSSIKQQARLISASTAALADRPARETIDWDCLRRVAEYREHVKETGK